MLGIRTLLVDVGDVLVVKHVVKVGNLAVVVGNDGEGQVSVVDLVDVLDPGMVRVDVVGTQSNELDAEGSELGLELGKGTKLGGADGGEVILQLSDFGYTFSLFELTRRTYRVREENNPAVADELVEVDGTLGSLSLEVGGSRAQTEGNTLGSGHYDR